MSKKSKTTVFWVLALLVLAAAAYFAKQRWFTTPQAPRYASAAVTRGNIEQTVLASGKLEAFQQVSVGAQVSGQVTRLAVELGQDVKAGDLIAEIDARTLENTRRNAEAALATARAQLQSQQANLAQAKLSYERQKQLLAADAGARADFESAEAAYKVAQASVQAQQAQVSQQEIAVDTAKVNLGYTRIVAPMDGQVVAVVTKEGQTVNANQSTPTIIILAQLDTMTIKAEISEADVTKVKPGQAVYFTILGEPEKRYNATLRSIEPAPESISSSSTSSTSSSTSSTSSAIYYNGLFDVPNPDHELRISMTAQVYIVQNSVEDVLVIPAAALGRRGPDGDYMVRVVDTDGQAQPRRVQIGLNNNISAQVISGLEEGDRVVVADAGGTSAARAPRQPSGPGGMRF
ncbi:efflux RND transporter periplasmic adaptor subunit [Corticibacter populi]|uniref:Efflux RND transporter periplasmic adaptor subunit n=1 Tax=Corticibacter populi TaxID=1550736 RepID=A0A3M6QU10_9BURK|nr:efflux RND transporter periplasmic adaptor subunit [Corticibacter populi]RMX05972.1 efflux RND transporter periplasmic adaptor subunit [Corticibacter populi]RZS30699.1 macrolide-specific efflux system membrane fusion protein [Corticibacter populi]